MSGPSRHRPLSLPYSSNLKHMSSVHSIGRPPPITVITTPPWARDEPPSPTDDNSIVDNHHAAESRPSDVASYSTSTVHLKSRWWPFTLPRATKQYRGPDTPASTTSRPERRALKDLSKSWLPTTAIREGTSLIRRDREKDIEPSKPSQASVGPDLGLSFSLPTPPPASRTVAQVMTPEWDNPWTPRTTAQGSLHFHNRNGSYHFDEVDIELDNDPQKSGIPQRRRRLVRTFILTNIYVPLLFRFINITFTATALAVAIHIRKIEIGGHIKGEVGSSLTLVIIFAPLTLVHVIVAIYLEYFGRPLGLWHTSGKLMHTLSEVLFICAWSAALSLCFDNFFTSLIPCASPWHTSWYNMLPRPPSNIPSFERGLGDRICHHQLALICLVGVGLMAYCANLIISLFRIFEKVKYHPAAQMRT